MPRSPAVEARIGAAQIIATQYFSSERDDRQFNYQDIEVFRKIVYNQYLNSLLERADLKTLPEVEISFL
jgi:hypothetical protein